MSTKLTPLINDISDAAGILRAHGHTALAERLLAFAEVAHKTERERAARICELMRPTGGRAWSAEQAACFEALSGAAKTIRGTVDAPVEAQGTKDFALRVSEALNHTDSLEEAEAMAQHKCEFNPDCTARCDVCPEVPAPQDREAKIAEVERALEQFIQTDPERAERFIQSQLAQLALRKRVDAQKAVQTLKLAIGAGTMQVGGRYKWKHQDERLVYLGVTWSGNRFWHQFALVDDLAKVWCEVPSSDLHMFELDTRP